MSRKVLYILLLLMTFANLESVVAQDSIIQSLDSSRVFYFNNNIEISGIDLKKDIDTLITGVERYDPLMKPWNIYASLGNLGHAHDNMIFNPVTKTGFDYGIHSFDKYLLNNDSVKYYWTGKPFTHIFYVMGPKREQNLLIDYAQGIGKLFNIGLYFDYTHSPGFYVRQKADDKNFVAKVRFHSKDYRYMVITNFLHNILKMQENGGIKYDSVFSENIKPARNGIIVNLQEADNLIKEDSYFMKHFFSLSKKENFNPKDTAKRKWHGINSGHLIFSSKLSKIQYKYQDTKEDFPFYDTTYNEKVNTFDSTRVFTIENSFSWSNISFNHRQRLVYNLGVNYTYAEISNDTNFTENLNVVKPNAYISIVPVRNLNVRFYGDFVTGSNYVGDYTLSGSAVFSNSFGKLSFEYKSVQNEPGRFVQNYFSNNFRWQNSFTKQHFNIFSFDYSYKTFSAGIEQFITQNLIYFDTTGYPAQTDNANILKIYGREKLTLRKWTLDVRLIYQHSNNDKIGLPEFAGDGAVYFTSNLFGNAAILQTGFDLRYNTKYFSNAYMPATRIFYLQNKKQTGDFLYGNIFLNLQIKRARLFVAYHNIMAFLQDYNYMTTPSYPMQDPGFRFGVSWMFYD